MRNNLQLDGNDNVRRLICWFVGWIIGSVVVGGADIILSSLSSWLLLLLLLLLEVVGCCWLILFVGDSLLSVVRLFVCCLFVCCDGVPLSYCSIVLKCCRAALVECIVVMLIRFKGVML